MAHASRSRTPLPAALACAALLFGPSAALAQGNACGGDTVAGLTLAAPLAGSDGVTTTLNTVYVAMPATATAQLPAFASERVLFVDDAGTVTEGGVLHAATRDDLPNDVPSIASAAPNDLSGLVFAETWAPALRSGTHYTAQLARIDRGNCAFATLGSFTTEGTL